MSDAQGPEGFEELGAFDHQSFRETFDGKFWVQVNAAIDGIVPTLALELAPTRVNAISPGTLRTTYWTGVPDDQLEQIFDKTAKALPAGRVGTPDDIANAVLFLVTTSFVTGSVLAIDGGLPHSAL